MGRIDMETNRAGTKRNARHTLLLAGSILVAFLAVGCGENKEQAAATVGQSPGTASEKASSAAIVTASAVMPAEATTTPAEAPPSQIDTLPPDVAASAGDSIATPGEVIEITAMASSDTQSLILTDALGKKYPFVYDATSNEWHVSYRVPIRIHTERLGLSVTAVNSANRFKRVWVFLPVDGQ
jgi:hypothetical protein